MQIDMRTCLKKAAEDFGQINLKPVNTLARNNLRKIDDGSSKVSEQRQAKFHSIVMLLMHVAIRGRRDIQPTISFLSQRVNACTEEDCDKLKRLIRYIAGTMGIMAHIGATDLSVLMHFADAAYAVHDDYCSHTGGTTTIGYGVVCSMSSKQKINTNSSTCAELVGVSNYFLKLSCAKLFLEAQGVMLRRNIIYQDNMSAMLMEQNGRSSCSRRSRHLNMRYFYVVDAVK